MNKMLHFLVIFFILTLTACSSNKEKKDTSELWSKAMTTGEIIKRSGTKLTSERQRTSGVTEADARNRLMTGGGLLGKKGLTLTHGDKDESKVTSLGMPINPYLWRASLESVSFMPLSSADPFGGIIITEWYNDKKNLNERCKVNVFVKGTQLSTNNLKAAIFCQEKISENWIDTQIDSSKNIAFENSILEKAKKLRLSSQ